MHRRSSCAARPFHTNTDPDSPSIPSASSLPSLSASPASPVEVSAQGLHQVALEAFRVGNRGRLSLCEALRVLSETRLYLDLGFPGLAAYADSFFQLRRAETFEYVRVARALVELTELREAFGRGRIGWSALKAITRVASVGSQATWVDFARENGVERTLAEARDALRRGRDVPRDTSFGLPNLDQKLVLRFSRSDMDKVRRWIESAGERIAESTGAEEVSLEQAVLFLCEKDMISPAAPEGGRDVSHRAQLVYQRCPSCRKARMQTRDGSVDVASEEVARFEGSAEQVVIDGPTPPRLRRRILAREAGRCGNPRCHHRAAHCHHIVFRSRGGKTRPANEVAVCTTCHALIHAGLLRVTGRADEVLHWSPVAAHTSLRREVASQRTAAERLPVLHVVSHPAAGSASGDEESAIADSVPESATSDDDAAVQPAVDVDALTRGLMRLGVPAARSSRMIAAAIETLPRTEVTEANVLRRAIASI